MKKQILLIVFVLLAILAGVNKSYAQAEVDHLDAVPSFCPSAITLTCAAGDALNPTPGTSYNYTITTSSAGTLHWFVTDDPDVLTSEGTLTTTRDPGDGTGNYILASDATYNDGTNTSLSIDLTWKSFDAAANEVLLVAYGVNAAGCTDNIEVYRIRPGYSFTLDVAGILDDGTSGAEECVAPVQSASYDGTDLNVQYGTNYVFFAVNAANWQTSWMPTFSATAGASTVQSVAWAYPSQANDGTAANWHTSAVDQVLASQYASATNGFIGSAGECIIVRVEVEHAATTESIVDETVTLTVNGEMINSQSSSYDGTYPDLDEGTPTCVNDQDDTADYLITPRPNLNEVDPIPFENKVPRD